jgi:hypothetical protein
MRTSEDPEVLEPDFEGNVGLYALVHASQVTGIVAWESGFYALYPSGC